MERAGTRPSVLIVTPTVLTTAFGGGVTLNKLFQGWPPDRIAQIHSDVIEPDRTVCHRFFSINGLFYPRHVPFRGRHLGRLAAFVAGAGEHGLFWARLTPRLRRWLDGIAPEVVFSQTGNLAFLRLTRQIVDYTGARLVLHASDDWVSGWPTNVLQRRAPVVSDYFGRTAAQEFAALVRRANVRLAICEKMATAYQKRYGVSWQCFYNPIDPALWPRRERKPVTYSSSRPFTILYSGSLFSSSQLDSLQDVARTVGRLAAEGEAIELQIATHRIYWRYRGAFERLPGVRFVDLVSQEHLPDRLAAADLLVLPSAFDADSRNFIRLSMPGKAAEYMMSGTPILVYGPPDAAVVEDAATKEWGYAVMKQGPSAITDALRVLSHDDRLRQRLAHQARRIALRDYDMNRLRPAFQMLVAQAMNPGRMRAG